MNDAFDLRSAVLEGGSPDVRQWPVTTAITRLDVGASGVAVDFSRKATWPDVTPEGWDGTIRYTLWIAMQIAGAWHVAGIIEFWATRANSGPDDDVTRGDKIARDWTYFCGPMARQPAPGESVGFFVTSGDQRRKNVFAVQERSNVVVVPFPAASPASFTFATTDVALPGPVLDGNPIVSAPPVTAGQFVNVESWDVAAAYLEKHGTDAAPSDYYQQAWRRLIEGVPHEQILKSL